MSAANNSNATEGRAPTAKAARMAGRIATRRADALFELVTGRRVDTLDPIDDVRHATGRASVLLTCPVDTLLDPDSTTPAWVLSTLTGCG